MEYTKQIFEILGVKPNEEFKITGQDHRTVYRILNNLIIQYRTYKNTWIESGIPLREFLIGHYGNGEVLSIIKIPTLTPKEQLAIDYAKACGCDWIAKDSSGQIFGYHSKPKKCKSDDSYYQDIWDFGGKNIKIEIPISFLSWKDEEPYYIGE